MTSKKKPGDFGATCRLTELRNTSEVDHEILATARAAGTDLIHRRGEVLIPLQCGHEFTERAQFEDHMASEHSKKARGPAQLKLGRGGWRSPKLTDDGKPFEPTQLEPGATVSWQQIDDLGEGAPREWVERSGQVWATGWVAKSAWVIPFDLLPGETAVLVTIDRFGSLRHHSTQLRRPQRVA